ncbi:hypothetical protein [Collinsella ihumii]|uniref:hypothetical protein n=1 Tax=Collinsella ihumii TaxID=1720204 RepID=UPI000832F5F4|nr:hypothetical protein [Collinsella ihumii]
MRWALFALPAACLAVALGALWWTQGVADIVAPSSSEATGQRAEDVSDERSAVETVDSDVERMFERAEVVMEKAVESSVDSFISDLGAGAEKGAQGAAVQWSEQRDLVGPAQDVLYAYAELPEAELMSSGYLDLAGNVWVALVQGGREWVDMVYLASNEERSETDVHIVRLRAEIPDS